MVLLLVFMQLTRDLFAIAKFLFYIIRIICDCQRPNCSSNLTVVNAKNVFYFLQISVLGTLIIAIKLFDRLYDFLLLSLCCIVCLQCFCSLNGKAIVERIKDNSVPFYRPAVPKEESSNVHPDILTLMNQCWAEEPSERPSFHEVAKALTTINKGKSVLLYIVAYSCNILVYVI